MLLLAGGGPALAQNPSTRPDLVVDAAGLAQSWHLGYRYFPSDSCTLLEGCINAPGWRRVVVFSTTTANISQNSFDLGDPTQGQGFHYDTCHGHYHYESWADYQLLDLAGQVVAPGHKQSFCVVETEQYLFEPWVGPPTHDCAFQGLDGGWADTYGWDLDCQWVDVTDVPGGTYDLVNTVNPARRIHESDYTNNEASVSLSIPDPGILPDLILDAPLIQATAGVQIVEIAPGSDPDLDGCVGGTGPRRLLTFMTKAINLSQGDLYLGEPAFQPEYIYDPAHNHFHLPGAASYELVDPVSGSVVATGAPPLWLLADESPYVQAPWVQPDPWYVVKRVGGPPAIETNTGLQRGWKSEAVYGGVCQWIDVTDVANGDYILRVTVNSGGVFPESDLTNNTVETPVTLDVQPPSVSPRPDGNMVPGTPLQVSHGVIPFSEPPVVATRVIFDKITCPAPAYNLFYSELAPGAQAHTGAICGLSTSGVDYVQLPNPLPGEMVWFLVAGQDGTAGGSHGFDGAGQPRPMTGIGYCGILQQASAPTCP